MHKNGLLQGGGFFLILMLGGSKRLTVDLPLKAFLKCTEMLLEKRRSVSDSCVKHIIVLY